MSIVTADDWLRTTLMAAAATATDGVFIGRLAESRIE